MFSKSQRIASGVTLVVALLGLANAGVCKWSLLGLDPKQLAILAFIPAFVVTYWITRRGVK
jgi:hypothetical protein